MCSKCYIWGMLDFLFRKKRREVLTDIIDRYNAKHTYKMLLGEDSLYLDYPPDKQAINRVYLKSSRGYADELDLLLVHRLKFKEGEWFVYARPNLLDGWGVSMVEYPLTRYLDKVVPDQLAQYETILDSVDRYPFKKKLYNDGSVELIGVSVLEVCTVLKPDMDESAEYADYIYRVMDEEILTRRINQMLSRDAVVDYSLPAEHRLCVWTKDSYLMNKDEIDGELADCLENVKQTMATLTMPVQAPTEFSEFMDKAIRHVKTTVRRKHIVTKDEQ